jgi:hypothetical protein
MTPHWTDEQLIAHFYGVGPEDRHIDSCAHCIQRLAAMRSRREALDLASEESDPGFEILAAQRRKIHERISRPARWWPHLEPRRWLTAAAALLVLAGGLALVENAHKPATPNAISDAQLAQDVSRMAADPEPSPTAPLQALFEE